MSISAGELEARYGYYEPVLSVTDETRPKHAELRSRVQELAQYIDGQSESVHKNFALSFLEQVSNEAHKALAEQTTVDI